MSDDNANVGDNGVNASTTGFGDVDWSRLVIEQNDDGFNVPVAEDQMFTLLGLRDDDERPVETTSLNDTGVDATVGHGDNIDDTNKTNYEDVDIEGAAIPVDDHVSEEENIDYDMDNPDMEEGDTFPSMEAFRVAIKQYGIMGEYDIETLRSEPGRFEGVCKAEGCQWKIKAKKVQHEGAIMVTNGNPSTPTSPGPITRSQSVRNISQTPTSPGPVTRSQAARSPSTPMRTDTPAQPSTSPGAVTRSQFALFENGGSQSVFRTPPTRTPRKSNTTTAKKITPRKRR